MHFRRKPTLKIAIDIAPLVDVVFLLVIFFAATTTFLDPSGLKLDLPTSNSTAERETEEISVGLSDEGQLEIDGEIVTMTDLDRILREKLAERERKVVVLRADSSTSHGEVVKIMDLIRGTGAEALTIATRSGGS